MDTATKRGAALTQQLLGFARKGKNQSVPVDLGAALDEVVRLLQRTIEKEILVCRAPSTPNLSVIGDPGQIQQVILNLSVNARDAMPDGGELSLDIGVVDIGADKYVRLTVADTGCGIAEDVRDRIFEPFFTTKEIGKGTGMGLAMVYGIVQNHGGLINVKSVVGMGTTFEILLPRGPDIDRTAVVEASAQSVGGTGRILVVEDEECVREVAIDLLSELGYDVSTAVNGLEAVEHYRQFHADIDAVLLDLAMPTMGGRECFRALKEINPEVRAVLCTGYGFNVATQQLLDEGMVAIVAKPYELDQLSKAIALAVNGVCRTE
jgi:CheY-like chemotaxis protein